MVVVVREKESKQLKKIPLILSYNFKYAIGNLMEIT